MIPKVMRLNQAVISFLLEDETPVGTVAMVPITRSEDREELCFELAKMAVRPDRRGKGYGSMLMQHCIDFARSAEAHEIMLVTNDVLSAAVALYEHAGFEKFLNTPMTDMRGVIWK